MPVTLTLNGKPATLDADQRGDGEGGVAGVIPPPRVAKKML